MNYLAHLYLSKDDKAVMLGNFIADMVTKKDRRSLSGSINKGIELHHKIDEITDHHPIVRHSRSFFFPEFRHYGRVIIDVLYDHYLAKNWNYYHPVPLSDYVNDFYEYIETQQKDLPERVQKVVPVMIRYNWLYNYSSMDGIIRILKQMSNRIDDGTQMDECLPIFRDNYNLLEKDFTAFFHDLQLQIDKE